MGAAWLCAGLTAGEPVPPQHPRPVAVADYVAPKDRSLELQAFDKAVLYLSALQEEDGHWDAKKAGASSEFCNQNGDVALTALATYVQLCTTQGKQQNRDAMQRAKRGLDWLRKYLKPDGCIVDESKPGEPVVAQLLATMAFLQSSSMSTRNILREAATATARYAILKMQAAPGGYGATPLAASARADITGLATFVFRSARMEDVKFHDTNTKIDTEIETALKAGIKALRVDPESKDGIYSMFSDERQPNWDASVAGALSQVLLLAPPSALAGTMKYIFKEEDKEKGGFPGLLKVLLWGEKGEGYRALSLWQGSMSIVYLYQEHTKEWKGWTAATTPILLKQQSTDGSWDAAGPDALRGGRVWRAGIHALALILLSPPPPPAPPPTDVP